MEIQWALVLFTVVAGIGAWLFAFAVLDGLLGRDVMPNKLESIVAFVLLAVGGCLSVLHLKHVDRILEALNHPTSGIFIEAALIGVCCVLIALYFVLLIRGASEGARKGVGLVALVVCAVFTYACGSSYMMDSRPAWTTFALPLSYFATAAVGGAGLNLLLKVIQKREDSAIAFAGLEALVSGVFAVVVAAVFCVHASSYLIEGEGALAWAIITFVGACIAAAIGGMLWKKPSARESSAMALCCVVLVAGVACALALRAAMWASGTPTMDFFMMSLA